MQILDWRAGMIGQDFFAGEAIFPGVHNAFCLTNVESGQVLKETLEIHTLELGGYNLRETDLKTAGMFECWLFWFIDDYCFCRVAKPSDKSLGYCQMSSINHRTPGIIFAKQIPPLTTLRFSLLTPGFASPNPQSPDPSPYVSLENCLA